MLLLYTGRGYKRKKIDNNKTKCISTHGTAHVQIARRKNHRIHVHSNASNLLT